MYRLPIAAVALGAFLALAVPSGAAEVSGSARVYAGPTKSGDSEADHVDQKYTLNLLQALTPYLSARLSYRLSDFRSSGDASSFERESSEPRLEILYNRPGLSGLLSFQDRRTRGVENFDLEAFLARLRWRPSRGPELSFELRDEKNVADVAVFGRDVGSETALFGANWDRTHWGARYSYQATRLDNESTGFRLDEDRHEARVRYSQRFLDEKVSLSFDSWISRREQHEVAGSAADPAEPVPVREGLFAIDTTPGVGELDVAPDLTDGDLRTPAEPRIEIGGANTFRNLGLDLGFTRQVTRLEVSVDSPSGSDVFWEVYHSSDNLTWETVPGVVADFDAALLRYTLRFAETTDRYWKAVNVSINSFNLVAVTEVRALLDVDELSRREGRSTTYRADLNALIRPHERVRASLSFGLGNDEDLATSPLLGAEGGSFLSRDLDEVNLSALVRVDLTRSLDLRVGYRFNDVEEKQEPVLRREEEQIFASLEYEPLPTVDATLVVSRRDEKDGDVLLRSADTARLRARLVLLPEMELISEVTFSDIDDPFAGFAQTVWRWRETLQGSPTRTWTLWATVGQSYFDSTGTVALERRSRFDLRSTWSAAPYLSLTGEWGYSEDDDEETVAQRYSVFWAPGPKLTASFSFQDTESEDLRETTSLGASVNYRLNPRFTPYANVSRSTFEQGTAPRTENTSLRLGFNLFF